MRRAALLAGVVLVLAGCGQKGPLYLPDQKPAAVTAPAPPAAAPAADPAANAPAPKKKADEDASQTPAPK
jgi:predicted small lipoprotein YifL